jgi:hypothetical protein
MRGGQQQAKPDVARPLDGRVRPHCGRLASFRRPHGTTPRGASDSWRLTEPAAQALRYSAGPSMNGDAANTDAALTFAFLVRLVLVAR